MDAKKDYPGVYTIRVLKPSIIVLHLKLSSFSKLVREAALYSLLLVKSRSPCSLFLKSSVY